MKSQEDPSVTTPSGIWDPPLIAPTALLRKTSKSLKNHGASTGSRPTSWGTWLVSLCCSSAHFHSLSKSQINSRNIWSSNLLPSLNPFKISFSSSSSRHSHINLAPKNRRFSYSWTSVAFFFRLTHFELVHYLFLHFKPPGRREIRNLAAKRQSEPTY